MVEEKKFFFRFFQHGGIYSFNYSYAPIVIKNLKNDIVCSQTYYFSSHSTPYIFLKRKINPDGIIYTDCETDLWGNEVELRITAPTSRYNGSYTSPKDFDGYLSIQASIRYKT